MNSPGGAGSQVSGPAATTRRAAAVAAEKAELQMKIDDEVETIVQTGGGHLPRPPAPSLGLRAHGLGRSY